MQLAKEKLPLVSIGIPTYNGGDRIAKALDSIQQQGYSKIEILISDNASADNTEEVVRGYMARDSRIRYFRQEENLGVVPNFEFILQKASGKYFFWISDDDELIPGVLERYVEFLESHPSYSLVSGKINYWKDGVLSGWEANLSFEGKNPLKRVLGYYLKVKEGAMLYGMMRREWGQKVRFWPTIGSDWHFVAGLAFLGKIKSLDFVGYNKEAGGISHTFHNYAKVFGESKVWGYLPYFKIAKDAVAEIGWKNQIYRSLNPIVRLTAGLIAGFNVLAHYYLKIMPTIIGGQVLRTLGIKTPRERKLAALRAKLKEKKE